MKRHQEILQIIFGIIMLGFICFLLYKFYTIIIQFPIFFSVLGGILILWLLYNFRITAARICLYFNPKIAYNLLKNHLEKGRAVALKKYLFSQAVYAIYSNTFYAGKKEESKLFKRKLKQTENYLTQSLDLLKERDKKFKNSIDKEKFNQINKSTSDKFNKKGRENIKAFFIIKTMLEQFFKMIQFLFPVAFKLLAICLHYSFLKISKVYYYRGITYLANEKYEFALEDFEASLETYYDKKRVLYGKARALYSLKRYQESLEVLEKLLEDDSKYEYAIYKRGSAHYKLGNTEAACKDWKLAIEYGYKEDEEEKEKHKQRCTTC